MNQNEATGERELGVGELSEGVLRVAAYRSQCCSKQQQSNNGSAATALCADALPRNKRHGDDGKTSVNVAYFAAAAVSGEKTIIMAFFDKIYRQRQRSLSHCHMVMVTLN